MLLLEKYDLSCSSLQILSPLVGWPGHYINVALWRAVYGGSATERPLGTIREEKGIFYGFLVSTSLWYDLSCWKRQKKTIPSFFLFNHTCIPACGTERVNDIRAPECNWVIRPRKINCLFPVTIRKKRGRLKVGKKKKWLFFWSKMCVLCMFYVDWELGGQKKLEGRDSFFKTLVSSSLWWHI